MNKYLKLGATVLAGLCFVLLFSTGCKEKLDTTWGKSATLGQANQSDSIPANDNGSLQPMWSNESSSANQAAVKAIKNTDKTKKD
ncbi:MAG: hypothetical protein ACRDE2_08765 [Chitinophagaceae bacterium]